MITFTDAEAADFLVAFEDLPPEQQAGLHRTLLRDHFDYFASAVEPSLIWHTHVAKLAAVLQRIADGDLNRVMIMMPPRMGKSLLASRLLTAWWLTRYPRHEVGLVSYGQELANDLSRDARRYYRVAAGEVAHDSAAITRWHTVEGGGMWARGVGGSITGRGAELLVCDDTLKGREEADSETHRRKLIEWYRSVLYTRLHPGAAMVVIGTRWHEMDLLGYLLKMEEGEVTEGWHVVLLDHEHDPVRDVPEACTVEPDWRSEGALLCPDRYDAAAVALMKAAMGGREWSALHQQRPMPREGGFFKYEWVKLIREIPNNPVRVRYWDLAGTEGDGDWTAGVLMSRSNEMPPVWTIEHVRKGQWSPGHRLRQIEAQAALDGPAVHQWFEQESGVGGSERTQAIIGSLAPLVARSEPATGSKQHRAEGLSAQMEAGNVRFVDGPWLNELIDEMMSFPAGAHDDQVDAAAGAFNKLRVMQKPKVVTSPYYRKVHQPDTIMGAHGSNGLLRRGPLRRR